MVSEVERLTKLETQMDNIEDKVDDLKDILIKFIEQSEERFASKWVEKAMWAGLGLVITAVIGALMTLILK